jgi:hypothetical protein
MFLATFSHYYYFFLEYCGIVAFQEKKSLFTVFDIHLNFPWCYHGYFPRTLLLTPYFQTCACFYLCDPLKTNQKIAESFFVIQPRNTCTLLSESNPFIL